MRRNRIFIKLFFGVLACLAVIILLNPGSVSAAYSLVLTNGYGDVYHFNLVRDRGTYQVYRGVVSYKGFSLSGMSQTGDAALVRIKATATMPEHFNLISTSMRWPGTANATQYILSETFRWLNTTTMTGYENWYPFDMSCTISFTITAGGFS
jgi:hypothetical protein